MPKTAHYSPFTTHRPGARLYHSTASVWLSVDPLSDKYLSVSPYVYCANNPVRLVDPDGRDVITPGDRPFGRPNYEQKTVTASTSYGGGTDLTMGWGVSLDANLSISAIGYSIEIGYVNDGKGNSSLFFSQGKSVGFEASVGLNSFSIPVSDFTLNDFSGKSMGININTPWNMNIGFLTDFSSGADTDYYFDNYCGGKIGIGLGIGVSMTHTKTSLFAMPQKMQEKGFMTFN